MVGPWPWHDVVLAASLGLAFLPAALIIAREEWQAGLRFGKAGPLLNPRPTLLRWMRRDRAIGVALAAIFVTAVSCAGLVYLEGPIEEIFVSNAGWGTGPRCFWSGGQLVLCSSPAERDAALHEEAVRRGYLEPSP
jgi:hypothetical protein